MSDFNAGERRIMSRIGQKEYVPVVGWEWGDAYAPLGGLGAGVIIGIILLEGVFTLLGPPLGFFIGALIFRASPSHVPATTWVVDMWRYVKRPKFIYSASANADNDARNEGGLANYTPFEPDTRTEDLTDVERAWPGAGAVLRSDGIMEGAIEVFPPNMDFASNDRWRELQQIGKRFANEELPSHTEFKFHATTEPFNIESLREQLDERANDVEIRQRPVFRELLRELRDHRPQKMEKRGTQRIRVFYIVTVSPDEATTKYQGEKTPTENLNTTPLFGPLFRWIGRLIGAGPDKRQTFTESERHREMLETLHDRINTVENGLVQDLSGYDEPRRLSTVELFALGSRFWNGNKETYREVEGILREQPMSRAARDATDAPSAPDPSPNTGYADTLPRNKEI